MGIAVGIGTAYLIYKSYTNSKEIGTLNKMLEAMNPAGNFGNQCQQVAQSMQGINQGIELVIH